MAEEVKQKHGEEGGREGVGGGVGGGEGGGGRNVCMHENEDMSCRRLSQE